MASGFPWVFAQPIGFIKATFIHLNLFIFYTATTPRVSRTKSKVVNSHLHDVSISRQMLACLREMIAVERGREEE